MGGVDFEQFVRARSPTLARVAFLLTGDQHAAEDLLQESLIRAAQRWERITRGGADPEPYVRRILVTRHIDQWRRERRHAPATDPQVRVPAYAEETGPAEDAALVRAALMRLTPRQRAVLVLRFLWDLTEVETARALDCSPNTVKSQTRLALRRLRELAPDLLAELRPEETR